MIVYHLWPFSHLSWYAGTLRMCTAERIVDVSLTAKFMRREIVILVTVKAKCLLGRDAE